MATPASHSSAPQSVISRRDAMFAAGAAGSVLAGMSAVHAQNPSDETIRVGLIGCGGRGTGALQQTLSVPGSNVKVTAVADAFEPNANGALRAVDKMKDEGKVDVPDDRKFIGLDAYQKLIDLPDIDLVILATPPGFRPFHFEAAIKAGKHVFMEKPVCVDSFGARLVLEVAKLADEKNRKVVVGLQRHYEARYRETIARVREGLAGDIIGG
jgi:myo-inositol 2-dehydrogenase/D-chiro-inositol 1-dehydrogenase